MHRESFCADDEKSTIKKYSNMVYRLAYSLLKTRCDADDIHQEVFIKYLSRRPVFENEQHAKAWFIRVTVNMCKNFWKSAWRQRVIALEDFRDEATQEAKASELIETVKLLPQKYRVVIHLFYYEEMNVEEIAQILGLKSSNVRTQLTRARRKLKEMLKEDI